MKKLILIFFVLISFGMYSQRVHKFIENKGQWNENVQFKTDIDGGYLYLEKQGLVYDFYDSKVVNDYLEGHHQKIHTDLPDILKCHSYQVNFIGMKSFKTTPKFKSHGYNNYFIGNDKSKWASRVFGFKEVNYNEIYNGIELKFYSNSFSLKYDFIVKPNVNPSQIKMKYEGVNSMQLSNGNLVIKTSVNTVKEEKPFAYQIINGNKVEVVCKYVLKNNILSYEFPNSYDKSKELIIDPVLIFSTYSGSTSNNFGYTATFDRDGFLYSGSSAFGTGYPTSTGAYDVSWNGGRVDVAITKYDTTGTMRIYSTFIGGNNDELPHSMITNAQDELFVYGTTSSLNFPYSKGCYDSTFNGGTGLNLTSGLGVNYTNGSDIFVIRLSGAGDSLMAGTLFGGSGNDGLNSSTANNLRYNYADEVRGEIEIDKNNNIYVVSCTRSTDMPTSVGAYQITHGGGDLDGCIFKMDNKLTTLIWSSYLGGTGDDAAYSIALDKVDNAYVVGGTNSTNFPTSVGAISTSYTGIRADGFITKFNQTGTSVLKSTYFGSNVYDQIYFVELDRKDSVYVFGQTDINDSTFIFNAAYSNDSSGQFISKLSPDLDTIEWSTVFGSRGGGPNISPTAFLVDVCNKIYLSGWGGTTNKFGTSNNTVSVTGMQTTLGAYQSTTDGSDFYLMVLESDASALIYGSFYGGNISAEHVDGGTSRFDRNGKMYQSVCAGCGGNSDFPIKPIPGAVSDTNGNSCNNGVFKFDFQLPITLADFDATPIICMPDTTFFRNRSQRGTSFLWRFGDGNTSTATHPYHIYSSPGTYNVTLIVTDTVACNGEDSITKQVTVLADTTWFLPNDTICDSSFKQIGFLPSSNPTITYRWSPAIGLSDTTISNPIAFPYNTTTYRLLISNGTCTDTVFVTVVVTKLRLKLPSDTSLCIPGGFMSLVANAYGSTTNFQWSSNSSFTDTINTTLKDSVLIVNPTMTTTYYIRIGENGCYLEDSIKVFIFSSQITLNSPVGICLGDTITISVSNSGTDTLTYVWSPNIEIISGQNTHQVVISPNATTYFSVTATNSSGCSITKTARIYVSPLPTLIISATVDSDTIMEGNSTTLHALPNGYSYYWTPFLSLSDKYSQDPIATPKVTTTYTVMISDSGCEVTAYVTIYVTDIICGPPDLFVPNSFTPNGDGENDILFVRGNNIETMNLKIYHRWGEKVFETSNQNEGWDGKYKGRDADPAVFVYYLEITCIGEKTYQEKGNITLIR